MRSPMPNLFSSMAFTAIMSSRSSRWLNRWMCSRRSHSHWIASGALSISGGTNSSMSLSFQISEHTVGRRLSRRADDPGRRWESSIAAPPKGVSDGVETKGSAGDLAKGSSSSPSPPKALKPLFGFPSSAVWGSLPEPFLFFPSWFSMSLTKRGLMSHPSMFKVTSFGFFLVSSTRVGPARGQWFPEMSRVVSPGCPFKASATCCMTSELIRWPFRMRVWSSGICFTSSIRGFTPLAPTRVLVRSSSVRDPDSGSWLMIEFTLTLKCAQCFLYSSLRSRAGILWFVSGTSTGGGCLGQGQRWWTRRVHGGGSQEPPFPAAPGVGVVYGGLQ
eukprot:Sspe_Gene.14248::Locus_4923_Transcript_2_2_Confidence_0.600_Length_1511::g.14248::m.14248